MDRRELVDALVVKDAAQLGGQSQDAAYLRGCLVTTPEYFLAPPGAALKRTILHAKDRGEPTFQVAAHVMSMQDFIASHGQLDTNSSFLGVATVEPVTL